MPAAAALRGDEVWYASRSRCARARRLSPYDGAKYEDYSNTTMCITCLSYHHPTVYESVIYPSCIHVNYTRVRVLVYTVYSSSIIAVHAMSTMCDWGSIVPNNSYNITYMRCQRCMIGG